MQAKFPHWSVGWECGFVKMDRFNQEVSVNRNMYVRLGGAPLTLQDL